MHRNCYSQWTSAGAFQGGPSGEVVRGYVFVALLIPVYYWLVLPTWQLAPWQHAIIDVFAALFLLVVAINLPAYLYFWFKKQAAHS